MKKPTQKSAQFRFIGEIRTPYDETNCPRFADENLKDEARIIVFPEFQPGLKFLEKFRYIYVLFYLDRLHKPPSLLAHPPRAPGLEVGVFASCSPSRPNPIGLSIVRLKKIQGNELITSAIDAYDHTPLLDLKPYFKDGDCKLKANNGWMKSQMKLLKKK